MDSAEAAETPGGAPPSEVLCIVVTYNSSGHILDCLQSIEAQAEAIAVHIHDNASTDGTVELVRGSRFAASIEEGRRNLGFAAAVNQAAATSAGQHDYLLLLNPDAVLHPGAVSALVAFARRNPQAGLWSGLTLLPTGELEGACGLAAPGLWHAVTYGLGLGLIPGIPLFRPDSLGGWDRSGEREVPAVSGAFLLVDRQLWRDLGGFDERYFMYGEDVDLCLRAARLGRPTMVTDSAACTHVGGASSASRGDYLALLLAGRATLYRDHARPARLAVGMLTLGTALRALLERVLRPAERGWRDAWRRRREWQAGWTSKPGG